MNTTKQQIADTFERHVQRFGYAKTTLDEVAAELHISKKTIYVHFDGKRDIYATIVARQAAEEQRRMAAMLASLPDERTKAETLVRFVLSSARAHIEETTESEWLQEYEIAADAFRKANGDLLRQVMARGIDSGEFASGDVDLTVHMIETMILEYTVMVNSDPEYDHDDELVRRVLGFMSS